MPGNGFTRLWYILLHGKFRKIVAFQFFLLIIFKEECDEFFFGKGTAVRIKRYLAMAALLSGLLAPGAELEMIVLPGGLPGTLNLEKSPVVQGAIDFCLEREIPIAAICAAPFILGELDLLEGRHATCFPGFEKSFPEGAYTGEKVTQDGNIITASGMAQSLPFALELLRTLAGDKAVDKVAEGIQL